MRQQTIKTLKKSGKAKRLVKEKIISIERLGTESVDGDLVIVKPAG